MRPSEYDTAPECKAIVIRLFIEVHSLPKALRPVALQKTKRRMGMDQGREKGKSKETEATDKREARHIQSSPDGKWDSGGR